MKLLTNLPRRAALAALVLVLGTSLGLVNASPAAAGTWSYTLLNSSITTNGTRVPLVALPALSLTAGANKYLNGSYTSRNDGSVNLMQGAQIRCRRMSDDALFYSVYTTRNVTPAASSSTARVHWLFTVPSTDSYACTVFGHSVTSAGTNYRLTVTSGSLGVDDGSYPDAAEWRHTTGGTVATGSSAYLLRKSWTAVAGNVVGANADVELTNNYGSPSNGRSSTADVSLYVTQLAADGTGCVAARITTVRITIAAAVHHDKAYLSVRGIPVSTAAGCTRRFAIKVLVSSVSGNPLVLEGSSGSHYSNGIAFSS